MTRFSLTDLAREIEATVGLVAGSVQPADGLLDDLMLDSFDLAEIVTILITETDMAPGTLDAVPWARMTVEGLFALTRSPQRTPVRLTASSFARPGAKGSDGRP